MTKIVHLGKYYHPDSGGIESVTESLARGLAALGHQITVVCFKKTKASFDEIVDGVTIMREPIWRIISSQPLGLRYFLKCIKVARVADIVHLHTPNMLAAVACLFIGNRPKLVVHWHSDVIGKGVLGVILRPLETALLKRADCIVTTSPIYANASPILKPFFQKVSVIPIGIAFKKLDVTFQSEKMFLQEDLDRRLTGKKIILAVGRLVPYKGFSVLINAAKKLREDAVVVIVGGGEMHQSLSDLISQLDLSESVFLVGRLDDNALLELYQRADLYCMPSVERSEAFGVVLLEAMAHGLPIVASNIPGSGVPWVNQHEVTGLNVAVGDSSGFADACNRILSSEFEWEKFSKGARARFMSEFTEELSVSRMRCLYEQLQKNKIV